MIGGVGCVKNPQLKRLAAFYELRRLPKLLRTNCERSQFCSVGERGVAGCTRPVLPHALGHPLPHRDQRRFPLTYSSTSSPAQASRPSWMAKAAMTNPATGSSQAAPVS